MPETYCIEPPPAPIYEFGEGFHQSLALLVVLVFGSIFIDHPRQCRGGPLFPRRQSRKNCRRPLAFRIGGAQLGGVAERVCLSEPYDGRANEIRPRLESAVRRCSPWPARGDERA